jgi:acetylornithine deacetylase
MPGAGRRPLTSRCGQIKLAADLAKPEFPRCPRPCPLAPYSTGSSPFPTVSRDSNLALIDWVEDYLAGQGVRAHRVWNARGDKASLFAHIGPEVAGGVVLSGHTDVVPVDGQDWTTDPWQVSERDGRLHGRGTCDMKGFLALALAAVPQARDAVLARPLQLALSHDEEVGCVAVTDLIDAMSEKLPPAAAVIVGEPSMMRVVSGHKGGTGYQVHVHGVEVHSSMMHHGVSAIMQAARLIDWANRRNAESAAANPGPLAAPFDPPWTTLHVGTIRGGTAGNITARDCCFGIEFRVCRAIGSRTGPPPSRRAWPRWRPRCRRSARRRASCWNAITRCRLSCPNRRAPPRRWRAR